MTLVRISDGELFIQNDDGTFTRFGQYFSMPTTYYKYSYERLMQTGQFKVL